MAQTEQIVKHRTIVILPASGAQLGSPRVVGGEQFFAQHPVLATAHDFSVSGTLFEGNQPALKTGRPGRLRQLCLECSGQARQQ